MDKLSKYFQHLKNKKKSITFSVIVFFILGFFYVLNETPKYSISLAVSQNNEESQAINPNNIVSLALGQGSGSASKFYYDLSEAFFSMEVTRSFNQKHNGVRKFFGAFYDESTDQYRPMWNFSTRLQYIKFLLLGIKFQPIPNIYSLNNYVKGTISINYDEFADLIYITSLTDSPIEIKELIVDFLKETDNYFKTKEKNQINERINFLSSELSSTSSISQRDAISRILQNQLLKKSLVGTNELYKIKIIRDIEISEYPVQPNVLFILALFSIFGFFMAIGFHTFSFAKDEFEWNSSFD